MDGVTIRVPYRHLNEAELELVGLNGARARAPDGEIDDRGDDRASTSLPASSSPFPYQSSPEAGPRASPRSSLRTLVLGSMVGAGVQFGWALQLSLLTPYIQTLGIGHAFSSFIWLCGPITGFIVQPCVGIWSDKCHSKYGRRRPFIFAGCLMISVATLDSFWETPRKVAAPIVVPDIAQLLCSSLAFGCWILLTILCKVQLVRF